MPGGEAPVSGAEVEQQGAAPAWVELRLRAEAQLRAEVGLRAEV